MIEIVVFGSQPYDEHFFNLMNVEKNFGFSFKFLKENLTETTASLAKGYEVVCAFVNDTINDKVIHTLYNNSSLVAF